MDTSYLKAAQDGDDDGDGGDAEEATEQQSGVFPPKSVSRKPHCEFRSSPGRQGRVLLSNLGKHPEMDRDSRDKITKRRRLAAGNVEFNCSCRRASPLFAGTRKSRHGAWRARRWVAWC